MNINEERPVKAVCIDVKVVLQIIKHGQDDPRTCDNGLDGFLTGLPENGITNVTQSFRNLNSQDIPEEDYNNQVNKYQTNFLTKLRKGNQDHIMVGFYKKTSNFNIISKAEDLNDMYEFQKRNDATSGNGTVMLAYDEHRMSNGDFGMRAFRISKKGMDMYEEATENNTKPFSISNVKKNKLSFDEILEEIPISIKSSNLMNCLLHQIENDRKNQLERNVTGTLNSQICRNRFGDQLVTPAYSLACTTNIEDQTEAMKESIEEVSKETKKFLDNQRNLYQATSKKNNIINKLRYENEQLIAEGKEPKVINEDDIDKQVRMPEEYNRLQGLVLSYQSDIYCDSVKNISAGNIGKLFVADGMQDQ